MGRLFFLSLVSCLVSVAAQSAPLDLGYESAEVSIESKGPQAIGNCSLGATLLLPHSTRTRAVVVFVHGSGPSNRDERIPGGYVPFENIAEFLSTHEIATLRFDKRTSIPACLKAIKDIKKLRPANLISDVRQVVTFVRRHPLLQRLPLFLLGHSEGVNFVLESAKASPDDYAGVILLAGLGKHPIDQTALRQLETLTHLQGEAGTKNKVLFDEGKRFFSRVRNGTAKADEFFLGAYTLYWKDWIDLTERAAKVASQVRVPSLLMQGELDTNVSKEDFEALRAALGKLGASDSAYFPALNHLFTYPDSKLVATEPLVKMVDWIKTVAP